MPRALRLLAVKLVRRPPGGHPDPAPDAWNQHSSWSGSGT